MYMYKPGDPVWVIVPVYSIKLWGTSNQAFRTGQSRVPGVVMTVPSSIGHHYTVAVGKDFNVCVPVESISPGYDIDMSALKHWLLERPVPTMSEVARSIRGARVVAAKKVAT
jgi:hypothetical protein